MSHRFLLEDIAISYKEDSRETLLAKVKKLTGHNLTDADITLWRRSLDCRAKSNIHYVYAVLVDSLGKATGREVEIPEALIPEVSNPRGPRPVVVGFGPAGLFAAYFLAKAGARPLVLERGPAMEKRVAAVSSFWAGSAFLPEANVQFGEGGAGTFSDGKLTSRSKDPISRQIREVLVDFGADPSIVYSAKPHIGTDKLRRIIPEMRAEIERLGGEVRFETCLKGLEVRDGRVCGAVISGGETIATDKVLLGIGHSARDTFAWLAKAGVVLEAKPFAVGVRAEHSQALVNESCYGKNGDMALLPPAEYTLAHEVEGRGCYSFCMCPGGQVVNAASEAEGVVVNGMSLSGRASPWANAALVVSVKVEDYFNGSPLDGIAFQRRIERAASLAAGNSDSPNLAPCSDLNSFLNGVRPGNLPKTSFRPGVCPAFLGEIFPEFVGRTIAGAMPHFERSIRGYASSNPLLIAPETRTSSPVRIPRDLQTGQSVSVGGLFPMGEGAGYAGGIVSAAIDGWRAAERVVAFLKE